MFISVFSVEGSGPMYIEDDAATPGGQAEPATNPDLTFKRLAEHCLDISNFRDD